MIPPPPDCVRCEEPCAPGGWLLDDDEAPIHVACWTIAARQARGAVWPLPDGAWVTRRGKARLVPVPVPAARDAP